MFIRSPQAFLYRGAGGRLRDEEMAMAATIALAGEMSTRLDVNAVLRGLALARALVPHEAGALRRSIEAGCRRLEAAGRPARDVQRLRNYARLAGGCGSPADA
jgi:hypothetical protein